MVLPAETNDPVRAAFTPILTVLSAAKAPPVAKSVAAATTPHNPRLIGFLLPPTRPLRGASMPSHPMTRQLACQFALASGDQRGATKKGGLVKCLRNQGRLRRRPAPCV